MTFKHITFSDSPIMRSLEKVAAEKGLLKPEAPIKKEASSFVKKSYKPTDNLMQDLITLCSGLRDKGFDSYAEELEDHITFYKLAAKEDGEKLIHDAHPEGSPKLDMLGDATVENILDKHLAILKVVQKEPTGKLSNASDILSAVKFALAQDAIPKFNDKATWKFLNANLSLVSSINNIANTHKPSASQIALGLGSGFFLDPAPFEEALKIPSVNSINKCKSVLSNFTSYASPGIVGGVSKEIWESLSLLINQVKSNLNNALNEINAPKNVFEQKLQQAANNLRGLKVTLDSFRSRFASDPDAQAWIAEESSDLEMIKQKIVEATVSKSPESLAEINSLIAKESGNISKFQNDWLSSEETAKE